jgi:hypothetical protein
VVEGGAATGGRVGMIGIGVAIPPGVMMGITGAIGFGVVGCGATGLTGVAGTCHDNGGRVNLGSTGLTGVAGTCHDNV